MAKSIAIIGAGSFSGINLSKFFMEKGYNVTGFTMNRIDYYRLDAIRLYRENNSPLIEGDIRKLKDLTLPTKDADIVINLLALIEAPLSMKKPSLVNEINVKGFLNVLEAVRQRKIHLIVASSNLVYGNPVYNPINEEHPLNPQSLYGATRVAQEKYAIAYKNSFGLPITILRYSNLYGPKGYGVINLFLENALRDKPLIIEGGKQKRTFTHIEDAAKGTLLVLRNKKAIGETFNIAGPESVSIENIAEIVNEFFPNVKIKRTGYRAGDITSRHFLIDTSKARRILKYEPTIGLREGIRKLFHELILS